ncbi:NBR1-Ig-like domain-containing protein [Actinokineospora soli]|uniref:NBR1-Ig-like domain-containing protein n=1 Tax=Actinokineospora soli TaxID=1048753 RepID=A0ABW2TRI2_9PSEU
MAGQADAGARRELVSGFASGLRELREAAGTPSFRRMAGVSGVISHTTLHEAAGGSRFPSWETTREFVKACGGDEREWRAKWLAAKAGLSPEETITPLREEIAPRPGKWWTRGRLITIAAAAAAALVAVFAVQYFQDSPYDPLHAGDFSEFVRDVTIPDGTQVQVSETFTKVWEIHNKGTVLWQGRAMRLENSVGGCIPPPRLTVGTTPPGDRVMVTATVIAAADPGICKIDYKMVDEHDRVLLPGSRPIFLLVNVVGPTP